MSLDAIILKKAYRNALRRQAQRGRKRTRNFAVWQLLIDAKVTQTQIAKDLGLQRSLVSNLLAGRVVVDRHLDRIAAYFGVTRRKLDTMIRGKDTA